MHSNQKLTRIIAGRTISGGIQGDGVLNITFGDGATMKIKTAPSNTVGVAAVGKVVGPGQEAPTNGAPKAKIPPSEPTSQ